MARVFLDTNVFIDITHRQPDAALDLLTYHQAFVSPLSFHILYYTYKIKVPSDKIEAISKKLNLVDLTNKILASALSGPTADLEDNIQLHSAAAANCDIFLTRDEKLAKLIFFGHTKITTSLS